MLKVMNFELIAAVITASTSIVLGSLVLIRNTKTAVNRSFAVFAYTVGAWIGASYLSNGSIQNAQLVGNRLAYTFALTVTVALLFFSWYFPIQIPRRRAQRIFASLSPLFLVLTLTPLVVETSRPKAGTSVTEIIGGPLYLFVNLYIVLLYIFVARNFYYSYGRAHGADQSRVRLIAYGISVTFIWVAITAALVPYFTNNWELTRFAPSSVVVLVIAVGYTIIRHKLFDIRLIVARSLGYILTLGTLVGVYVLTIFGLSSTVLGTGQLTGVQQALYIVATLIFGFSLQPLKKFFDKLTNRLFYRDAYDAQELLDKLNKVLVGNIDLDVLLKQTSDLLALTLKAEYVAFVIRETKGTARRASYSKIVELDTDDLLHMHSGRKGKTELFVADEIEGDTDKLKTVLSANNVSIAARMVASGASDEDQGYLLLGAKQSGNPYNKQDLQILDIIANELVIAIQNAIRFEEIETFNITLQQKVNDATKQLRQTNEKLKALDETKDEFISMASHQLRTPLTAVKGYVSMVVEGDAGKLNKQQKELLDQAFASSQRMVYLIADLLNVSRLRSGKFVIENKPTQLADVVASEMEQLTEVAKGKDQTLSYNKPDKFPLLMLDETKIRQVIMNFADNALHYTQNGGHIQINLEDKGDSVQYTVVDDGIGVPKSEQHHMFTKFYRANNAKKARPDGTGLGLFMAKKVIIAQGGAIIFQSEEGKGSTFGFTFPKSQMLAPAKAKANPVINAKTTK